MGYQSNESTTSSWIGNGQEAEVLSAKLGTPQKAAAQLAAEVCNESDGEEKCSAAEGRRGGGGRRKGRGSGKLI